MNEKKFKSGKTKRSYSLEEIRDIIADMSRGGDPDEFIPYEAKVAYNTDHKVVTLTWDE